MGVIFTVDTFTWISAGLAISLLIIWHAYKEDVL